jgi:two-component sensor histidine kinase
MGVRNSMIGSEINRLSASTVGAPAGESEESIRAALDAALAREEDLRQSHNELLQRQKLMAREFEHRLVNGLQLVVSLLSLQSRASNSPEASEQLTIAARRVAALGRVHHRLHLLDHQNKVEVRQYLENLCHDLSGLLFGERADHKLDFDGVKAEIPTKTAIPLGFIVNELITNGVKYAGGNISVRFEKAGPQGYSLAVEDDGPGLPAGFDPAKCTGLGMKIILSLVKQIGGTLQFESGAGGRNARFAVTFVPPPLMDFRAFSAGMDEPRSRAV